MPADWKSAGGSNGHFGSDPSSAGKTSAQKAGKPGLDKSKTALKNGPEFKRPMVTVGPDIWHKNSDLNLFQIVSAAIARVSNRVSVK